jgi:SAM-dependent methyltransferase
MIDFPRYLAAKKSVDDRALNRFVWEQLRRTLSTPQFDGSLRVLELGCGIGTMVERLLEWGLAEKVIYLGIDSEEENIRAAEKRIMDWGSWNNYLASMETDHITLRKAKFFWQVRFQEADVTTFQANSGFYDLLIANAFMDLIDVPRALDQFTQWLVSDGLFYFTINFDGATIFEPISDPVLEAKLMSLYHQSMDERLIDGQRSGDSQTGRHMFTHLQNAGASILSAGASDWVVYPGSDGYPEDEAYFLHCILDFFEHTLKGHPALKKDALDSWLNERRRQIEHAELTYIAHQLDFLGTFNRSKIQDV